MGCFFCENCLFKSHHENNCRLNTKTNIRLYQDEFAASNLAFCVDYVFNKTFAPCFSKPETYCNSKAPRLCRERFLCEAAVYYQDKYTPLPRRMCSLLPRQICTFTKMKKHPRSVREQQKTHISEKTAISLHPEVPFALFDGRY